MYDECQQVEVRVPVDICKRRRFDEDSIFLNRGRVFRKEGELRRTKLFRRNLAQRNGTLSRSTASDSDGGSSSSSSSSSSTSLLPGETEDSDDSSDEDSIDELRFRMI